MISCDCKVQTHNITTLKQLCSNYRTTCLWQFTCVSILILPDFYVSFDTKNQSIPIWASEGSCYKWCMVITSESVFWYASGISTLNNLQSQDTTPLGLISRKLNFHLCVGDISLCRWHRVVHCLQSLNTYSLHKSPVTATKLRFCHQVLSDGQHVTT